MHFHGQLFQRTLQTGLAILALCASSVSLYAAPQAKTDLLPASINPQKLSTLAGTVHPLAQSKYDQGALAASKPLKHIVLVLKRSESQEAALQTRLQAQQDPNSSLYHRWLTPDQIGQLYGISDSDLAKIEGWLTDQGLQIDLVARSRGYIQFTGSVQAVNSAFHTEMHTYSVEGKAYTANASAVHIPTDLRPTVAGVLSLHNFVKRSRARVLGKLVPNARLSTADSKAKLKSQLTFQPHKGASPNVTSTDGEHYVGPGDLWTIYNVTPLITSMPSIDGASQTIAVVGRSDVYESDITAFRANLLPPAYADKGGFEQIAYGDDPGQTGTDDTLEQTLDVEYTTALAPAATIKLVVAASTDTTDGVDLSASYIVDNNLAPVMSTSYGQCEAIIGEAGDLFYSALWEQAAAQGITAMVSTGDNGSAGCDLVGPSGSSTLAYVADEGLQVNGLASTPYNVAVGGTEFYDDSTNYWSPTNSRSPAPYTSALSYVPEEVWNESCSPDVCGVDTANIAAASGGASGCFNATWDVTNSYILSCDGGHTQPDWQLNVYGMPTDGKRHLPDVSLTAAGHDGYMVCLYDSCNDPDNFGFYVVGGTSAAAPSFAGIMSLVNQYTGSRQGQANYTLYRLGQQAYGSVDSPSSDLTNHSCSSSSGPSGSPSCIFHDTDSGTNAVPCDGGTLDCSSTTSGVYGTLTGYQAVSGYDLASGLGSVNGYNLVTNWTSVARAVASTSLKASPSTLAYGDSVSLNVTVTPNAGSATPTGDVGFTTDNTALWAASIPNGALSNGSYTATVNNLPGGVYNLSAHYAGDATYAASTSNAVPLIVNPATPNMTINATAYDAVTGAALTSSSTPYGSKLVINSTLVGKSGLQTPSGTVNFMSGTTTVGSSVVATNGTSTITQSGLPVGSYSITAAYSGDNNYTPVTSSPLAYNVVRAIPTLHISSTASYLVGSSTATVSVVVLTDSLMANPTGDVSLSVNGTAFGTSAVTAHTDPITGASEASATFSLGSSALSPGDNIISATYAGDTNYTSTSLSGLSLGFSSTAPTNAITLTTSSASTGYDGVVTLTAAVTTGGIPATSGTVEFFDGANSLGTAQVIGSFPGSGRVTGTATYKSPFSIGTHTLKAVYRGISAAPSATTSNAATVTISGISPSSVSITSAPNSSNSANEDLTATVRGYGTATLTGSVNFAETSVVSDLGDVTLNSADTSQSLQNLGLSAVSTDATKLAKAFLLVDLNGDGYLDLVSLLEDGNGGTGLLTVRLGKGDGTFSTSIDSYPTRNNCGSMVSGDFNGDGIPDFAVSCIGIPWFGTKSYLSIFLGNSDSTLTIGPSWVLPAGEGVFGTSAGNLATIDYDRDGTLDLAVQDSVNSLLILYHGNGDGTFTSTQSIPINGKNIYDGAIEAVDVNGDGLPDLVLANWSANSAGVFFNNGDGTFETPIYSTVPAPFQFALADMNGDGVLDMVSVNANAYSVAVSLGNRDGSFQAGQTYAISSFATNISVGNVTGDGKADVIVNYNDETARVGILRGNGDGTLQPVVDYDTGQSAGMSLRVADVNGDGVLDILSMANGSYDKSIAVLLGVVQNKVVLANTAIAGPKGQTEQVMAVYSGDTTYNPSVSTGITVYGSGALVTPSIVWSPEMTWGSGIPLGSSILNAGVVGNIAGTISYTAQLSGGAAVAVTLNSTLISGTYTLTATFTPVDTASYTTATVTRQLVVQSADFAVTSPTSIVTIVAGESGAFTVSVPALYGFTGNVTMSSGTLPGGFTFAASPVTVAAGNSSTITIATTGISTTGSTIRPNSSHLARTGMVLGGILLTPFVWRRRRQLTVTLGLLLLAFTLVLDGCGGDSSAKSTTSLTLATSANKVTSGSMVTLTAGISGKNVTGTVTFYNGSTALGTATVSNGSATLSVSNLPVGLNTLTASYEGDTHNNSTKSSSLKELITGQTSVTVLGSNGSVTHSTTLLINLR